MKTHIVSDLHLEFGHVPHLPGGDLLLLCGDTVITDHLVSNRGGHRDTAEIFFTRQASKYGRVLVIEGNHEPYHGCIDDSPKIYRKFLAKHAPNATLLDNETAIVGGIAFIGSTLWAPCIRGTNAISELAIGIRMSDFRVIRKAKPGSTYTAPFTTADARARHQEAVAFIVDEVKQHERVVVMTHHAPSYQSMTRYAGDALNPAYCSDLDAMIEANPNIMLWAHAHTHCDTDYRIGKTRVFSNQRGYPQEKCFATFRPERGEVNFDTHEVAA